MNIKLLKIGGKSLFNPSIESTPTEGTKRVSNIIKKYLETCDKLICVLSAFGEDTDSLVDQATRITTFPDSEMNDILLSTGEQKAIALIGMSMIDMGINTVSLTGWQAGIETTNTFNKASILNIDTTNLIASLNQYDLILIAGFQGVFNNRITTLGRGGSDTTAVALAIKLKIEECIFLKDVSGVYTADPKVVSNSIKIDNISHNMLMEISSSGAEIINMRAAELAKINNQVLIVKDIGQINSKGTKVTQKTSDNSFSVVLNKKISMVRILNVKNIPGKVHPTLKVFEKELVKISYMDQVVNDNGLTNMVFLINEESDDICEQLRLELTKQMDINNVEIETDISLISLISDKCLNDSGVVFRLVEVLSKENIFISGINTSEIKISFVIQSKKAIIASKLIHEYMINQGELT